MSRRRTRGEVAIEALLQKLDPKSERYQVLACARDFKAAWVALGEQLTRVKEDGSWKEWGYASFEAYSLKELRLRNDTVAKLTRSFSFLRDHEPALLESSSARELPPLDVIDLLSRARERAAIPDTQMNSITREVFDPEQNTPSRAQLLSRFRELDPEGFAPARERKSPVAKDAGPLDVRKALLLAERLNELLDGNGDVSAQSRGAMRDIVSELRELLNSRQRLSA